MNKGKTALLFVLTASLAYAAPTNAETASRAQTTAQPITIFIDDQQLHPAPAPLNLNGTVLVPMRDLFEHEGAKIAWNNVTKTVTATKSETTLTYRIGEQTASVNGSAVHVDIPGRITDGSAMVPLRLVSEALGSAVKWDQAARTVRITSAVSTAQASVLWGVNLRNLPSAEQGTALEMLPAGSKVHVIREVNASWLEVRTSDGRTGAHIGQAEIYGLRQRRSG